MFDSKFNNWLKKLAEKSKLFYHIIKFLKMIVKQTIWGRFGIIRMKFQIGRFLRKIYKYNRFGKIKKYKDLHLGERCFIVATGPSLTLDDVEKLKGEYTFSMNSIIQLFPKNEWRPTYYAIQDFFVFKDIQDELCKMELDNVFYADLVKKYGTVLDEWIPLPVDYLDHLTAKDFKKYNTSFSEDCSDCVYEGYNIVYTILQLAVYMGFKEIYLLGADCNYQGPIKHFEGKDYGLEVTDNPTARILFSYEAAKRYCDKHGIKIYNATRGGMLEIFPRVDLDLAVNSKC